MLINEQNQARPAGMGYHSESNSPNGAFPENHQKGSLLKQVSNMSYTSRNQHMLKQKFEQAIQKQIQDRKTGMARDHSKSRSPAGSPLQNYKLINNCKILEFRSSENLKEIDESIRQRTEESVSLPNFQFLQRDDAKKIRDLNLKLNMNNLQSAKKQKPEKKAEGGGSQIMNKSLYNNHQKILNIFKNVEFDEVY